MSYITLSPNGSMLTTTGSIEAFQHDQRPSIIVNVLKVVLGEAASPKTALVPLSDLESQLLNIPGFQEHYAQAHREIAAEFLSDKRDLKYYRLAKGYSQTQLASVLGVSQPNINRFENGKCDLKLSTIIKLAKALDVQEQDIIDACK